MTALHLPALAFEQGPGRVLYTFAIDGRRLGEIATVSRLRRRAEGGSNVLIGYQRPEIQKHIAAIRQYLESDHPILPNALVVAFDERVHFKPRRGRRAGNVEDGASGRTGTMVIPIDPSQPESERPGWVVDGQQRLAALREADPQKLISPFSVCVVSFIAESEAEQREQFILVNATRPLPKSLIYELLPVTEGKLPVFYERRRFPARLLACLNTDSDSPFFRRIKTPTNPSGDIKDNSVLRMLENSLSDGSLYGLRDAKTNEGNMDQMLSLLKAYWSAVGDTFPVAWSRPPRSSRLTHGAGIISMGFLMDAIADRMRAAGLPSRAAFAADLENLSATCRWTSGYWEFGPGAQRRWNEIQNTSTDINILTNYLLVQYKALVWNDALRHPRAVSRELPAA